MSIVIIANKIANASVRERFSFQNPVLQRYRMFLTLARLLPKSLENSKKIDIPKSGCKMLTCCGNRFGQCPGLGSQGRDRIVRSVSVRLAIMAALSLGALGVAQASADTVTFTTNPGSDSDGPLAATIAFTAINGGIEITVTNMETGTLAKGQAVSAFSFTVGNGLATPTAFTKLTGSSVDSADFTKGGPFPGSATVTPFSNTPGMSTPNAIDHWGFSPSGSNVSVATAGSSVSGATGHPLYMILPGSGITGNGSSLADGHFDPYILGSIELLLRGFIGYLQHRFDRQRIYQCHRRLRNWSGYQAVS